MYVQRYQGYELLLHFPLSPFILAVLGVEPGTFCMLDKHSATELQPRLYLLHFFLQAA